MRSGYKNLGRPPKRPKKGVPATRPRGRPKGSESKSTIEARLKAQRELIKASNGKIATEHMDEQIGELEGLIKKLYPFDDEGRVIKGKSSPIYFRAFELFRDFLCMRAPYQSPRLSAVAIAPARSNQKTVVSVTILNERGEKVYADPPEDTKVIEHVPKADEEAA